jgi:hypothetical protein
LSKQWYNGGSSGTKAVHSNICDVNEGGCEYGSSVSSSETLEKRKGEPMETGIIIPSSRLLSIRGYSSRREKLIKLRTREKDMQKNGMFDESD